MPDKVIVLNDDGTQTAKEISVSGVPYTGATSDVDLGEYQLKLGQLEFDQTPTSTFGVGKMRWNNVDGTLDLGLKGGNVTLQLGQEQLARVVNKTITNITLLEQNYQVVKIVGATGQRLSVDLAQADSDLNSATTLGVVTETILNNQEGFITTGGQVREINTTGSLQGETWNDGDILYLSPTTPGKLTNIKPTAPNHTVVVGYVEYSHGVHGKIFVKVDNGYELEELHDVSMPTYIDKGLLYRDTSTNTWKHANLKDLLKVSPTITEIEIDFGTKPLNNKTFTITDSNITSDNIIVCHPSPNNATGQVGNDWEVDGAIFSAKANTGSMTLYVNAPFSINGKRKIYYQILN